MHDQRKSRLRMRLKNEAGTLQVCKSNEVLKAMKVSDPIFKPSPRGVWLIAWSAVLLAGCQNGMTGFPNLGNPTRVPPPQSGTFQIPPNYSDAVGGGAVSGVSNLGQLRALESGKTGSGRITPDGFAAL